jgi:hypothetical protein
VLAVKCLRAPPGVLIAADDWMRAAAVGTFAQPSRSDDISWALCRCKSAAWAWK